MCLFCPVVSWCLTFSACAASTLLLGEHALVINAAAEHRQGSCVTGSSCVLSNMVFTSCLRETGSVKYVWPLQTALPDFGAQRKRLDAIRSELGWPIIGCKYVECYKLMLVQ